MDFYSASGIPILWCCFFQTIAIGWIFGTTKFAACVEQVQTGANVTNDDYLFSAIFTKFLRKKWRLY
jgi:solute carrier family 6 GABA transporter-like protein 1